MKVLRAVSWDIGGHTATRFGIILQLGIEGAKPASKRHVALLTDCSGSMSGSLDNVKGDSARIVAEMGDDDIVSIISFSGEGQARVVVPPTPCNTTGRQKIQAGIKSLAIVGTTVFGEPLELALKTVQGVTDDADNIVLLLTDGCAVPTRSTVEQEHARAAKAAKAIANVGATLSLIGYGNWYDSAFLARLMAEAGQTGIYKHIAEIENFSGAVGEILETAGHMSQAGIELTLTPNNGSIRRMIRTTPEISGIDGGTFRTTAVHEGQVTLFIETNQPPSNITLEGRINGKTIKERIELGAMNEEDKILCARTIGAWAFLSGDTTTAQALFAQIGDATLADKAGNAFSDREQRGTSDAMRGIFRKSGQHLFGAGLKSAGSSHNVLNVLKLLFQDEAAVVFLPRGAYKRGGVATSDPRVIETGDRSLRVSGLVSKDDRFNFSVLAEKDIKLLPESGEGQPTDAKVMRTYNIIRDGNLVTTRLEASMSETTYNELVAAGVIDGAGGYRANKVYVVDLSDLKLVSHVWAQPVLLDLVGLLRKEAELEVLQTALGAHKKALKLAGQATTTIADDETDIYNEQPKKVPGLVEEHYQAQLVEYRLMGYKPTLAIDVDKLDYAATDKLLRQTRRDLSVTRFNARAITFACERAVKKNPITWDAGKLVKRGKIDKLEQTAMLQGAKLKRVTGIEECVCS